MLPKRQLDPFNSENIHNYAFNNILSSDYGEFLWSILLTKKLL